MYECADSWLEFSGLSRRNAGPGVSYGSVSSILHSSFIILHFPVTEPPTQESRMLDQRRNALAPGPAWLAVKRQRINDINTINSIFERGKINVLLYLISCISYLVSFGWLRIATLPFTAHVGSIS